MGVNKFSDVTPDELPTGYKPVRGQGAELRNEYQLYATTLVSVKYSNKKKTCKYTFYLLLIS